MKKLLPVLLLSSLALTACVVPYDYYDSGRQDGRDRYDQRYERYDDRYDQRYDDKRYDDQNDQRYDRYDDSRYRRDGKYYDDDYIEYQIYNDPSFEQKRAQVMRILERRGYQVHEIEADDRRGRPGLKAEALKEGRQNKRVFSPCRTICTVCGSPPCPDLNLIHYIFHLSGNAAAFLLPHTAKIDVYSISIPC